MGVRPLPTIDCDRDLCRRVPEKFDGQRGQVPQGGTERRRREIGVLPKHDGNEEVFLLSLLYVQDNGAGFETGTARPGYFRRSHRLHQKGNTKEPGLVWKRTAGISNSMAVTFGSRRTDTWESNVFVSLPATQMHREESC